VGTNGRTATGDNDGIRECLDIKKFRDKRARDADDDQYGCKHNR